jgi:hypothetical protein
MEIPIHRKLGPHAAAKAAKTSPGSFPGSHDSGQTTTAIRFFDCVARKNTDKIVPILHILLKPDKLFCQSKTKQ